jgi:serine/threonine-protein kinase
MKCPHCNSNIGDDSKFCKECGTNISINKESQPQFTKTLESPAAILGQEKIIAERYEITEKIGEGGMGEVYRAVDLSLDRQVAIKILPAAFAEDAERLARFEREAKLLALLNHTNIAAIYGLEESQGRRFLVLELVEGETLKSKLDRGPIDIEEALDLCRHITEGLEAAHEKGIIHRDLKPGNIMVTPKGEVKA